MHIAARYADGWNFPASAIPASNDQPFEDFISRFDALKRACDDVGRDVGELEISVQLRIGDSAADRRSALEEARRYESAGCQHLVIVLNSARGVGALNEAANELAEPLAG